MRIIILACLMLGGGLVKHNVQTPRETSQTGDSAKETQTEVKPLTPAVSNVARGATTAPTTSQNKPYTYCSDQKSKHWFDFIDPFSTFIIAIFTALTFAIVRNQLKATKIEKRAWLISHVISIGKSQDTDVSQAIFRIMNSGQTPAWVMAAGSIAIIKNKGEALPPSLPNYTAMNPFPIDGQLFVPNQYLEQGFSLPETLITQILAEEKLVYVTGFAEYRDVYGEMHLTRYCYQIKRNLDLAGSPLDGYFAGPEGYNEIT